MSATQPIQIELNAFASIPTLRPDPEALRRANNPHRIFMAVRHGVGDDEIDFAALSRIPLGGIATARQYFVADLSRRLTVAVHRFGPTGEVELVMVNNGLPLTRGIFRNIARWVFCDMDQRRLLARIRSDDRRTQDLARRAGFTFEGRAAQFFADDVDACHWAMTRSSCPWR